MGDISFVLAEIRPRIVVDEGGGQTPLIPPINVPEGVLMYSFLSVGRIVVRVGT